MRKNKTILFFKANGPYGFLSNFYQAPIIIDDLEWPTVEHYYQAQKTTITENREQIRLSKSPDEAKSLGRKFHNRTDWEEKKVEIMKFALEIKFNQQPELKQKLIDTNNAVLHEDSPNDFIWGWRNNGLDYLGKLLMEIRAKLFNISEQDL